MKRINSSYKLIEFLSGRRSGARRRLAELVLTLNCFSFRADSYYEQINGVAMGTKMEPSYANLFVGYIELKFFNQYNGSKPELYRSYIDDCVNSVDKNQIILQYSHRRSTTVS